MKRVITYPTLGTGEAWEWTNDVRESEWSEVEHEFAAILDAASDEKGNAVIPQFGAKHHFVNAEEIVYYAGDPTTEQSERLDAIAEMIWKNKPF